MSGKPTSFMSEAKSRRAGRAQTRRRFIKTTGAVVAVAATPKCLGIAGSAQEQSAGVSMVLDPLDPVVKQRPVQWAVEQLQDSLKTRGVPTGLHESLEQAPAGGECILVAGRASTVARPVLENARLSVPDVQEASALVRGSRPTGGNVTSGNRPGATCCGMVMPGVW